MNATPPHVYQPCQTRTAATTLSARPVSEMALGVKRDSMSRLRAPARRSATSAAARCVLVSAMVLSRRPGVREGPGGGPRAGEPARRERGGGRGERAEEGVGEEVVGR